MKGKDEWNHRLYLYLFFFQLDIGPLKEQKQWKIPIQQLLIANNTYFWWFFGKPLFFPFSLFPFQEGPSKCFVFPPPNPLCEHLRRLLHDHRLGEEERRGEVLLWKFIFLEETRNQQSPVKKERKHQSFFFFSLCVFNAPEKDTPAGGLLLSFFLSFFLY